MALGESLNFKIEASDGVTPVFANIEVGLGKLSAGFEGLGKHMDEAAQHSGILQNALGFVTGGALLEGLGKVMDGFGALKDGLIGGNAEFEQYNTRFQVLLGSADAAKERMAELADFGQKTPFDLPQVVKADTILQGFGLHSQEAAQKFGFSGEQIRTIAGDVSSGTGASFEEMATLIGKFSSGATGEAISRMQELGITNRDELSKMGLQFSKAGELMSPLPQSMEVILGLMQKKYGGLMDAQSHTFAGMMSNLDDWKAGTLRKLGEPIFEVLKGQLGNLLDFLGSPAVSGTIDNIANMLAGGIGAAMEFVSNTAIPAFKAGWDALQPGLQIAQNLFAVIADMMQGQFGVAIDDLHEGLINLIPAPIYTMVTSLGEKVIDLVHIFADLGIWLQTGFNLGGLQGALAYLQGWAQQAGAHLSELGHAFLSWAQEAIPPMLASLQQLGAQVLGWIQQQAPAIAGQVASWIGALQDWTVQVVPGLLQRLAQLQNSILDWITAQVPPILGQLASWASAFIQWIVPMIPGYLEKLGTLVSAMIEFIGTEAGNIIDHLGPWGQAFISWIGPNIPPMLAKLGELLGQLGAWASETALPAITAKLSQWGESLVAWIGPRMGPMLEKLGELLSQLGAWLKDTALPAIKDKLLEWGKAFIDWVGPQIPPLLAKLGELLSSIGSWLINTALPELGKKAAEVGSNLISALASAVTNGVGALKDAVTNAATDALNAAKHALGIQSPSKEFLAIGENMMNAWAAGIFQNAGLPLAAMEAMGRRAVVLGTQIAAASVFNAGTGGVIGAPAASIMGGGIVIAADRIFNAGTGGYIGGVIGDTSALSFAGNDQTATPGIGLGSGSHFTNYPTAPTSGAALAKRQAESYYNGVQTPEVQEIYRKAAALQASYIHTEMAQTPEFNGMAYTLGVRILTGMAAELGNGGIIGGGSTSGPAT